MIPIKSILVTAIVILITSCGGITRSIVPDRGGGLIWQASDGGEMTWKAAHRYCLNLTLDGKNNWRLPTIHELERAYNIKSDLSGPTDVSYWSSQSGGRFNAAYVKFDFGVTGYRKKTHPGYVRCVHKSE